VTDFPQCPACGQHHLRPLYAQAALPLKICDCGLVSLHPQPTEEELRALYSADYYASWGIAGDEPNSTRLMKRATFASRLAVLPPGVKPGKVLDVGCATGAFLDVARDAGWDVYGVELSSFSSGIAQQTFGERVFCGMLHQAGYATESFDLVTLSDLLEHVSDPGEFLVEAHRVLRDGGTLLIVTPNVDSATNKLMKQGWSHYKQEHLWYFSPETLRCLLENHGFVVESARPAPKYLNLAYIINQFRVYPHPLLTPLCRALDFVVPEGLKTKLFPVLCGEMVVVASRRPDGCVGNKL
jgi:SAM-dependent methyltransferase